MVSGTNHYEYIGVIHIHSKYSDGSGNIKKIVKEAKKAKLDYIMLGDHNNIKAKENGEEGWHDGILLLSGEEIGVKRANHYLAFGINKPISPNDLEKNVQKYIEEVKKQDGIGFIAHPYGIEKKQFQIKISAWENWENPDYTGMEIWSYMHDWSEDVHLYNIIYYYLYPDRAIEGPPEYILNKWDELSQRRRIVGIGSSDVHAKFIFPFTMFQFLSYRRAFKGVRTHIILPSELRLDFDNDQKAIYRALRNGNCFFAYDNIADSKGFRFEGVIGDSKRLIMGDEAKLTSKIYLIANSPFLCKMRLIKDGKLLKEVDNSLQLNWETNESGVYRIEARYSHKPWVYTNPIYLR